MSFFCFSYELTDYFEISCIISGIILFVATILLFIFLFISSLLCCLFPLNCLPDDYLKVFLIPLEFTYWPFASTLCIIILIVLFQELKYFSLIYRVLSESISHKIPEYLVSPIIYAIITLYITSIYIINLTILCFPLEWVFLKLISEKKILNIFSMSNVFHPSCVFYLHLV